MYRHAHFPHSIAPNVGKMSREHESNEKVELGIIGLEVETSRRAVRVYPANGTRGDIACGNMQSRRKSGTKWGFYS